VGGGVVPTYAFPVHYLRGGSIWPHRDVSDNHYSLSLQLNIAPREAKWPLHVEDVAQDVHALEFKNNDGVFYVGTELTHWRDVALGVEGLTQMIFAWRSVNASACVSQ
jgi:hypothetical protein